MTNPKTFAGLTGAKIGDNKPGPAEDKTTEVGATESTESTEVIKPVESVVEVVADPAPVDLVAAAGDAFLDLPTAESDPRPIFTCHPVVNMNLGRFQFRAGQLKLEADDVAEFEGLLAQQPPQIRNSIKKIDIDGANRLASEMIRNRQTAGIETTGTMLDAPNARPFG